MTASDGGGAGAKTPAVTGASGTVNTGGGAGGGQTTGGAGGSGIVIIAYPDNLAPLTVGAGLTYTTPSRSGYRVYQFTAGTGTVSWV
jgi:hypothetical protein